MHASALQACVMCGAATPGGQPPLPHRLAVIGTHLHRGRQSLAQAPSAPRSRLVRAADQTARPGWPSRADEPVSSPAWQLSCCMHRSAQEWSCAYSWRMRLLGPHWDLLPGWSAPASWHARCMLSPHRQAPALLTFQTGHTLPGCPLIVFSADASLAGSAWVITVSMASFRAASAVGLESR